MFCVIHLLFVHVIIEKMNPVLSSGSRNFTVISLMFFVDVGPVISVDILLTYASIQAPTHRGVCSFRDLK